MLILCLKSNSCISVRGVPPKMYLLILLCYRGGRVMKIVGMCR